MTENEDLIFALDIGTRTVVGVVFEQLEDRLVVKGAKTLEHQSRSMLDGQIHNVPEVAAKVKEIKLGLEEELGIELQKVAIAAAGRALKTVESEFALEFESSKEITAEDIRTLEFTAVQRAQERLMDQDEVAYHFVGYSTIKNRLDEMVINDLLGQRGAKISVQLVATFLPRVVVDSLLTVIKQADLEVDHLTLEPIAASTILIPQHMHDFNLALIDIGAGTADIAVTQDGSIIGYAMVPVAGDEITEAICDAYMLDYHTAERIKRQLTEKETVKVKDILDQKVEVATQEIMGRIEPKVEELAKLIAEEIIDLNRQEPQAVICFGGGSLSPLFKDKLGQALNLTSNRIGIKHTVDSHYVEGGIEGLAVSQEITPLGIGVSSFLNQNKANFLDVKVNQELIHLFTLGEAKVADALLAAEIDFKDLEPTLGLALTVEVNGEVKIIPGQPGTAGKIILAGEEVELDTPISDGAEIEVEFGEKSQPGQGVVADVVPEIEAKEIEVNNQPVLLEPKYYLNGQETTLDASLADRDEITYREFKTVEDVITELWELDLAKLKQEVINYSVNGKAKKEVFSNYQLQLNNQEVGFDAEIETGDRLFFEFEEELRDSLTVEEALEGMKIESELELIINNRSLEIPNSNFKLLKNEEETTFEAKVEDGDQITYQIAGMTIRQVLNYINYNLSPQTEDKMSLKKNGQPAQLEELVSSGDKIDIQLSNSSTKDKLNANQSESETENKKA
ncbi:cell division protein FtsA [Fuchsiella alkaliacetigena]|uniref:cell division protein FtsA n=1 Tax=Fuchsiella alkaliacetigena TaxID=957042 RepID=UPI00200B8803|nr:cell division FtsA domain-containing protein [Fuchsiella alkaliacetigena]MCK8824968.1 pilus assembly protein PilM [Fuchsiella alkaliacetigena]